MVPIPHKTIFLNLKLRFDTFCDAKIIPNKFSRQISLSKRLALRGGVDARSATDPPAHHIGVDGFDEEVCRFVQALGLFQRVS